MKEIAGFGIDLDLPIGTTLFLFMLGLFIGIFVISILGIYAEMKGVLPNFKTYFAVSLIMIMILISYWRNTKKKNGKK